MLLFFMEFSVTVIVVGKHGAPKCCRLKGIELPVLHLLTKTVDFFLKQPQVAPLSGVTGRRSQTENGRQTFSMK
jgi:hypothetical protein